MLMIDLCSGLGGASKAMMDRDWNVTTVDIESRFAPDFIADVQNWSWGGERPDLIWASPPCDEFSRESMPWSRTGKEPDLSIVEGCKRIIQECDPRYWIIENVRGAQPWLGSSKVIYGPFFLWGVFPDLGRVDLSNHRKKESYPPSKNRQALRALIPYELSLAVARAIELQPTLMEMMI